jgi:hypothetical protein
MSALSTRFVWNKMQHADMNFDDLLMRRHECFPHWIGLKLSLRLRLMDPDCSNHDQTSISSTRVRHFEAISWQCVFNNGPDAK